MRKCHFILDLIAFLMPFALSVQVSEATAPAPADVPEETGVYECCALCSPVAYNEYTGAITVVEDGEEVIIGYELGRDGQILTVEEYQAIRSLGPAISVEVYADGAVTLYHEDGYRFIEAYGGDARNLLGIFGYVWLSPAQNMLFDEGITYICLPAEEDEAAIVFNIEDGVFAVYGDPGVDLLCEGLQNAVRMLEETAVG